MFTDASSKAYGAAVYTVNDTHTKSNLLISKARVAPCREVLIFYFILVHLESVFSFL